MRGRVLVVEDNPAICAFVGAALADEGYEVATASDGQAALAQVRERPPDLILLDLWLPALDGWAFAQAYRQTPPPHAPIVTMTAASDARRRATGFGAAGHLGKPFGVDALLACVARHTRGA